MFYLSPLLIMAQQIFMSDELYISSSASLGEMVLGLAQFSSFIHVAKPNVFFFASTSV